MPVDTIAPRSNTSQQTDYIRRGFAFNAAYASTGVQIGTMPLGAFILSVKAYVQTAFNAGTTNVLTVGTTLVNANELFQSGDITPGTVGYTNGTRGLGTQYTQTASIPTTVNGVSVDTTQGGIGLWAKFTSTGTAPTAGSVVIVVEYAPANDT